MNDQEKQAMINKMVAGELYIKGLSDEDFYELLEGLKRMYFARVWNCCDASGKMDHEWSALSDIFQRVCEERGAKRASRPVRGESIAAPHPDPLTPEPIQPGTPKMVPGEERPMSRPEAAYILAKLATSRRVNAGGVIALQMGARAILKRHFDRQRNWAKRRALRSAAPHPAPLTPEEELADTIKRQKEADAQ